MACIITATFIGSQCQRYGPWTYSEITAEGTEGGQPRKDESLQGKNQTPEREHTATKRGSTAADAGLHRGNQRQALGKSSQCRRQILANDENRRRSDRGAVRN
ncbi:unnamed protein product [Amoebophrya sp. A120]|nr:unnamed protein product [Amoebophrya sp. A120]|eukprot:GSA120T00025535001.1